MPTEEKVTRDVKVAKRRLQQDSRAAIRDVHDALVELVTNADDAYQRMLETEHPKVCRIEIEVVRRRAEPTLVRVRDFAQGLTRADMDMKIGEVGDRVSGMESGRDVRGTNSRGAKDIQALGDVTFESIAAKDGQLHQCTLKAWRIELEPTKGPTGALRKSLGITKGSGTRVTLSVGQQIRIPQHEHLLEQLGKLVPLREILADQSRELVLIDTNGKRRDKVKAPRVEAQERVKRTFNVPGYPGATAKIVIKRATRQFVDEQPRFRVGGILVKSRHAVHEATYFDERLSSDPHAAWFVGRLKCNYIDQLWNEFDEAIAADRDPPEKNPEPVVDPQRKAGLVREHPFVKALYGEARKLLMPLVEEERKRAEGDLVKVEDSATRRKLNQLEKLASQFLRDETSFEADPRDQNATDQSRQLREKGFSVNPPFLKLVVGHSARYWLNINTNVFHEVQEESSVQVTRMTRDISVHPNIMELEPHPKMPDVLRAQWSVTGETKTEATGLVVAVGPIRAETTLEVLGDEKERYEHITGLVFSSARYRVKTDGSRKPIQVLCPLDMTPDGGLLTVHVTGRKFQLRGETRLVPKSELGVAIARFGVSTKSEEATATIKATLGERAAEAQLSAKDPPGVGIKIKLEPTSFGNQRSQWKGNVLEIAARHPSIERYLGAESEKYPGQRHKHFRLLVAEVVADAVVRKALASFESDGMYEGDLTDWDFYYAEYQRMMSKFLPQAHKLQVPDP